jgi:probable rRNA maturation factor
MKSCSIHTTLLKHKHWYKDDVFRIVADAILPKKYEVSIVLIGNHLAKRLNTTYRQLHSPANVLSFPLSKNSGEIFVNIPRAKQEAKKFSHTPKEHTLFLLIHALLHLAGYSHSSTMERMEEKYFNQFNKYGKRDSNKH